MYMSATVLDKHRVSQQIPAEKERSLKLKMVSAKSIFKVHLNIVNNRFWVLDFVIRLKILKFSTRSMLETLSSLPRVHF